MTISELLAAVEPRLAVGRAAPAPYRALDAFDRSIDLDPRRRELVRIRVSQLNAWNRVAVSTHMVPEL